MSAVDDGNITELCSNEAVDAIGVSTNENIGYSLDDVVSVDDSSSEILIQVLKVYSVKLHYLGLMVREILMLSKKVWIRWFN